MVTVVIKHLNGATERFKAVSAIDGARELSVCMQDGTVRRISHINVRSAKIEKEEGAGYMKFIENLASRRIRETIERTKSERIDFTLPRPLNCGHVWPMFEKPPVPSKIIHSGPKTIVLWKDGSKTIVSRKKGDPDDHYAAFCAAVCKKLYGSTSAVKRAMEKG